MFLSTSAIHVFMRHKILGGGGGGGATSTVSQNKSIAPSKIDILMDTFWTTDISLLDVAH